MSWCGGEDTLVGQPSVISRVHHSRPASWPRLGLPYASALGLKRRSRRGQEKAMCRKKKQGKCGERGEEDDSDDGESDDEGHRTLIIY